MSKPNNSQGEVATNSNAFDFDHPIKYYDIHVYFDENSETSVESAKALHLSIRNKFSDVRIFELVPYPIGPHPIGMFELHLYNKEQFSKVVPWLNVNRGAHSALLHPNTPNGLKDHSDHAIWLGDALPLKLSIFNKS